MIFGVNDNIAKRFFAVESRRLKSRYIGASAIRSWIIISMTPLPVQKANWFSLSSLQGIAKPWDEYLVEAASRNLIPRVWNSALK